MKKLVLVLLAIALMLPTAFAVDYQRSGDNSDYRLLDRDNADVRIWVHLGYTKPYVVYDRYWGNGGVKDTIVVFATSSSQADELIGKARERLPQFAKPVMEGYTPFVFERFYP